MSSNDYLRTEKVHINESSCVAQTTVQWFAENKNKKGNATHPITHNNKLTVHISGKEGFAAIAKDIAKAENTIDLICWGFDPGMELVRNGYNWPRAETYGDLLIAAGRRGVTVRLLIWYCYSGGKVQKHMPGYTHGTTPWRTLDNDVEVQQINARHSLDLIHEHARERRHKKEWNISGDKLAAMAREEYCHSWYKAAFRKQLKGIHILTRDGDYRSIITAIAGEPTDPDLSELDGLAYAGTHHQKPILVDFAYDQGRKAVGYVMGLNSLTDYWDTPEHCVENLLREQGAARSKQEKTQGVEGSFDFETFRPLRDYACRIDGGSALIPLHENFERAWRRTLGDPKANEYVCKHPPSALLRKPAPDDSTVQIIRTQPEEEDFTIKEVYFNATGVAAAGARYLYIENQYFQYQDWATHLLSIRKTRLDGWNSECANIGKAPEDLPLLRVFIVIPAPEMKAMIPRTYDTLATLGQQGGMTGQVKMIDQANQKQQMQNAMEKQHFRGDAVDRRSSAPQALPYVVKAANDIKKPTDLILKNRLGLRVCVATLNASELNKATRRWHYREIYIHSKLLLIGDGFFTLGSANLNQRSMAVDSEINLATDDVRHATKLRSLIWSQLTGGNFDGGYGTDAEIEQTFFDWINLMNTNKARRKSSSTVPEEKQFEGFIVPMDDGRSSTIRLA
jgi:phosphatidylserine/phosphatidylglycerophosphate/cardiolipin synthase-like enzyme